MRNASRHRSLLPMLLLVALVAAGTQRPLSAETAAVEEPTDVSVAQEARYLELWQPPQAETSEPATDKIPQLFAMLGPPSAATSIAGWCELSRRQGAEPSPLTEALLHDADYETFADGSVPLRFEVLIDDVEQRYAYGTERPQGATGLDFPFYELCPLGFGRRSGPDWAVDVVHLANHRGDQIAIGLYKGTLPVGERAFLESQLGYSTALPDPAAALLVGQDQAVDFLLLSNSTDSTQFDTLRGRIVR